MPFQIVVINPGSTSTKAAVFEDDKKVFFAEAEHPETELAAFGEIVDQLEYRKKALLALFEKNSVALEKTAAFSARCTGLLPMPGGVYEVNELMCIHGRTGPGSKHAGNLGPLLASDFRELYGGRAFCVNPSSVDEFIPQARLTGFHEIFRTSRGHPLNQKEVAARYAASLGRKYEEINAIVVHMGGGISIGAHRKGKIIDNIDSTRGEGRMAPTRSGGLPAADLIELCFSGRFTKKELLARVMKKGGWLDLLGTASGKEVTSRISKGDRWAEFVFDTTAYQIAKDIGACAAVLMGEIDGILLTGGLAYSGELIQRIRKRVGFLAPVAVFAGEYEMEGLAAGALRVLKNEEEPLRYTAEPVFSFPEEGARI